MRSDFSSNNINIHTYRIYLTFTRNIFGLFVFDERVYSHKNDFRKHCMVITYSRVWINRVRLPILFVVS